jgi:beta-1,4-mannosyl-glycoprotein beta-1,4-N-acetylglucosaminyltransferase
MKLFTWTISLFFASNVFSMHYDPKIYDCFMFYNEVELLEVKLNELYDYVDYFVIVESAESHRGYPKPLYFNENKERFSKFSDKIIYVLADNLETNNPWARENHQRDEIRKGLMSCNNWDVVIIEDLDEIVRPSKLHEIIALLFEEDVKCVCCSQSMYYYYLNRSYCVDGNITPWLGSAVIKYADLKKISPQKIRDRRDQGRIVYDAGWHFSYIGGMDRVIKKLENFAHAELDTDSYKNEQRINKHIEKMRLVEIDDTYPKYIQENVVNFKELGLID